MCGRIAQTTTIRRIENLMDIAGKLELEDHYNIAPSMPVWAIRLDADGLLHWVHFLWGLIPHWAKDRKIAYSTFNAKGETVRSKPAFREAYRKRRCLIPVDGFYEWRREGGTKQPYFIKRLDGDPMLLAGLWESWEGDKDYLESCTVITLEANQDLSAIHHRMPLIIEPAAGNHWLDPGAYPEYQEHLLEKQQSGRLLSYAVDSRMNNARYDEEDCTKPLMTKDKTEN